MEYKYCEDNNFEDFASGRVLYSGKGIPNFPVRLLNEIFGRAASYSEKKESLVVYDPCCGGGYSLAVLGFFYSKKIATLYGSDVDAAMVEQARKNSHLLTKDGLNIRRTEIQKLYEEYHKNSHKEALGSCNALEKMLANEVDMEIFQADCTKELPQIAPDVIITDIPYGNLVDWEDTAQLNLDLMLEQLYRISNENTILAVCMDKKQKMNQTLWSRLEKQNIGKRKFEIFKRV